MDSKRCTGCVITPGLTDFVFVKGKPVEMQTSGVEYRVLTSATGEPSWYGPASFDQAIGGIPGVLGQSADPFIPPISSTGGVRAFCTSRSGSASVGPMDAVSSVSAFAGGMTDMSATEFAPTDDGPCQCRLNDPSTTGSVAGVDSATGYITDFTGKYVDPPNEMRINPDSLGGVQAISAFFRLHYKDDYRTREEKQRDYENEKAKADDEERLCRARTAAFMGAFTTALDVIGFIPVVGEAADAVNAVIELAQDDPISAALSALSAAIPVVGDAAAKPLKWAWKQGSKVDWTAFFKKIDDILGGLCGEAAGLVREALDALKKAVEKLDANWTPQLALADGVAGKTGDVAKMVGKEAAGDGAKKEVTRVVAHTAGVGANAAKAANEAAETTGEGIVKTPEERFRQGLLDDADKIGGGHAWEKHKKEFSDMAAGKDQAAFKKHIKSVMSHPSAAKYLEDGRVAYWDQGSGTIVIRDPNHVDRGTAFRPTDGKDYYHRLR